MTDTGVALFNLGATRGDPDTISVPLGPLYLASSLDRAGIAIDFYDYQLATIERPASPDSILRFLKQTSCDIIAISCWDQLLPSVLLATQVLKQCDPGKKIILGGMGPTGVSEHIVTRFRHVDFVIRGAGESALPEVVANMGNRDALTRIPGVCLGGDEPHITSSYGTLPPIDTIPYPAYDLLDLAKYNRLQVLSSRGCPYRCGFCSVPGHWEHNHVMRDLELFIAEVEFLHKQKGVSRIHILDDTFPVHRDRILDFCRTIKHSCPDLKWTCYARLDLTDERLCEEMASAGCDSVYVGVESGSNRVLKRLGKRFDTDTAIAAAELAGQYFHVVASFLWGLPFEDFDDFGKTLIVMFFLSERCRNAEIQFYFTAPLALSDLRREFSDRIKFSTDYFSFFTWAGHADDLGPEVLKLVRDNIDMFPGMGYFDSPDLEKKVDLARRLGLVA